MIKFVFYKIIMILIVLSSVDVFGAELLTNCAHFRNSPKWLTLSRVNRVDESVSRVMEWTVHRVEVYWYTEGAEFQKAHSLGGAAIAVTKKNENTILLGPQVNEKNFDQVFAHELVHVSSAQKYKGVIPAWLEEGLANHVANFKKVDYKWLKTQKIPKDLTSLSHPMKGDLLEIQNKYTISQALIEMISSRCDLRNLLRLSVRRKMEDYLENICGIKNINDSFQKWIASKSVFYIPLESENSTSTSDSSGSLSIRFVKALKSVGLAIKS